MTISYSTMYVVICGIYVVTCDVGPVCVCVCEATCDVGPVGQNNHILQPPRSAVAAGSLGRRKEIEKNGERCHIEKFPKI